MREEQGIEDMDPRWLIWQRQKYRKREAEQLLAAGTELFFEALLDIEGKFRPLEAREEKYHNLNLCETATMEGHFNDWYGLLKIAEEEDPAIWDKYNAWKKQRETTIRWVCGWEKDREWKQERNENEDHQRQNKMASGKTMGGT